MKLSDRLIDSLYSGEHSVISVSGAGGKTSTLRLLAKKFKERGLSVLITTTTKFQGPKQFDWDCDYYYSDEASVLNHEVKKGEAVYFAHFNLVDMKKYTSPRLEILSILVKRFDVTIIEADGSKMLPLKLHSDRDPVIIDETTATLAIMGASALGCSKDNVCFGLDGEGIVDIAFYQELIDNREGVLKRAKGKTLILINGCDAVENRNAFLSLHAPCPIILGSILKDEIYV